MPASPPTAAGKPPRRSTRISHAAPLLVTGYDSAGQPVREETATLAISCHGCRFFSKRPLSKGAQLILEIRSPESGSSATRCCVSARVVSIQKSRRLAGMFQIAVEFDSPQEVLPVEETPEDWHRHASPSGEEPGKFLADVERRLEFARTGTHYELLEVRAHASAAEIKRSYYRLARRFHPDRHMAHPDWTPRLHLLMKALTLVYRILSNAKARKDYDQKLAQKKETGPAVSTAVAEHSAKECLEKARECVAEKNSTGAILWLRRAVESDPRSSLFRTLLAQSLAAVPEYRGEAIEEFEKAIGFDPSSTAAHLQYAHLLEQMKKPVRARLLYARVLELDPAHRVARERMRKLS